MKLVFCPACNESNSVVKLGEGVRCWKCQAGFVPDQGEDIAEPPTFSEAEAKKSKDALIMALARVRVRSAYSATRTTIHVLAVLVIFGGVVSACYGIMEGNGNAFLAGIGTAVLVALGAGLLFILIDIADALLDAKAHRDQ
jgi:hypothetical protein